MARPHRTPHPTLFGAAPIKEGREVKDRYYTPDDWAAHCVELWWKKWGGGVSVKQTIADPHCGGGSFVRAVQQKLRWFGAIGVEYAPSAVWGADLDPEATGCWGGGVVDPRMLLGMDARHWAPSEAPRKKWPTKDGIGQEWVEQSGVVLPRPQWILGNPPYQDVVSHLRAMVELATNGVGLLLRANVLQPTLHGGHRGGPRWGFFQEFPPSRIVHFAQRPAWVGPGASDDTDSHHPVWIEWVRGHDGPTVTEFDPGPGIVPDAKAGT